MQEYLQYLNEEGTSVNYKSDSSNQCNSDYVNSSSNEHSSDMASNPSSNDPDDDPGTYLTMSECGTENNTSSDSDNPGTEASSSDSEGHYNSYSRDNLSDSGSCN